MFARVLALLTLLAASTLFPIPTQAQNSQICFQQVPDCISGRFAEFWQQHGGLAVFGLPTSPASQQTVEGRTYLVQQFERNRFELHPENSQPYDVLLSRLGDDLLRSRGRDWNSFPKVGSAPGDCLFFTETGHSVCGAFLNFFRTNGLEFDGRNGKALNESLALFGLPISEPQPETLADGRTYTVQWYERARLEAHPENQPPYDVQLGLLGNELRTPPPAAPPSEPALPTTPNARVEPQRGPRGTTFAAAAAGFRPGERIGVYVTAPDQSVYGAAFQVEADDDGVSEAVTFSTESSSDFPTGVWAITFEGVDSGVRGIAYFEVQAPPQAPPPANPPPTTQPGQPALPTTPNAAVLPERAPRGATFVFAASGFRPGEQVGVYVTAPDQSVYGAPFQVEADADGMAGPVTFSTEANSDFPTGVWALTFEGVDSGVRGIAYFEVTQ